MDPDSQKTPQQYRLPAQVAVPMVERAARASRFVSLLVGLTGKPRLLPNSRKQRPGHRVVPREKKEGEPGRTLPAVG